MSIENANRSTSTINPAQTPASAAPEIAQLDSLQDRDAKTESPTENRSSKPNWISRLFQGGSPSFTSKSGQRTAKVGGSEATQQTKTIKDRKGSAQVDKNTRSRFPKLRQAYESFKAFFKGLRPSNRGAKTETESASVKNEEQNEPVTVENEEREKLAPVKAKTKNEPAPVRNEAQKKPALVNKAMLKEKYQAISKRLEAKMARNFIATDLMQLETMCQSMEDTSTGEVSRERRQEFNSIVNVLARNAEEDLSEFFVRE